MATFNSVQLKRRKFIEELMDFSCGQDCKFVEKLIIYAECLVMPNSNHINETTFISQMARQFNMTNTYMISLVFDAVRHGHKNQARVVTLEEYCKLICTFITPDLERKIKYVFSVYDQDKDGVLSKTEIYRLLKPTIVKEPGEDQEEMLKELVELVLTTVDYDRSGNVDLEEFRKLVQKNVLYLELLGQCLPCSSYVLRFKEKLIERTTLEIKEITDADMSAFRVSSERSNEVDAYYSIKLDL